MDKPELAGAADRDRGIPPAAGTWIGLRGRLARPFWGWLGGWAVVCGALASNGLRWQGGTLLDLVLALLLVELAWGSLWDLAVGTDWFGSLSPSRPPARPASLPSLPYTRPSSLILNLIHLQSGARDQFFVSKVLEQLRTADEAGRGQRAAGGAPPMAADDMLSLMD